jgi:hypothetical protein
MIVIHEGGRVEFIQPGEITRYTGRIPDTDNDKAVESAMLYLVRDAVCSLPHRTPPEDIEVVRSIVASAGSVETTWRVRRRRGTL